MYRIFDAQHVYKFLRNLETRMYRTYGAQHGYEPIGSEPRICIVPSALNMVTSSSNLEPRMYRNFVAQHGYDVFDIGTSCFRNL